MSVYVRQSFCYKWYLNIWDKWSSIYFEYYRTVLILNFPYDLELTRASHIPHSVINYFLEIRSSLVAGIGAGVGISLISFVWRVSGGGLAALEQRGLLVLSPARNTQNIQHCQRHLQWKQKYQPHFSQQQQQHQHRGQCARGLAALE